MKIEISTLLLLLVFTCLNFISSQKTNNQFIQAQSLFSQNLFKKMNTTGNIVMSPLSIYISLMMVMNGARGSTLQEMQSVLHMNLTSDTLEEVKKSLILMQKEDLKLANALWIQKNFAIQRSFIADTRRYFSADVKFADFASNATKVRKEINEWVKNKTDNQIKNLFPPRSILRSTKSVLVNALYLKGIWEEKFNIENTRPVRFNIYGNTFKNISMMHMYRINSYYQEFTIENRTAKSLTLPYRNHTFKMTFLLPPENTKQSMNALKNYITSKNNLETLLSSSTKSKILVSKIGIPRFKIQWKSELNEVLSQMGMPSAFGRANFSGISDDPLSISTLRHGALIEVDEEGTKAGAGTGIGIIKRRRPRFERTFVLNRPFLFLLSSKEDAILFIGKFEHPNRIGEDGF